MTAPDCTFLIEAEELMVRVRHDPPLVIDARAPAAYAAGHIPGARSLSTYHCFVPDTTAAGMAAFVRDVAPRYAAAGVHPGRAVVVYEDDTGMLAARELWILEYLGHRHVRMLHGGLRAWRHAGGSVSTEEARSEGGTLVPERCAAHFIGLDEVLRDLGRPGRALIDVRDADEFAGTDRTECCERRGHLPTARWLEWTELLDRGRYKSPVEIHSLLRARGIDPNAELVPYCHRGARSANTYYALRYSGLVRVRNFIGSFHEWSAHREAPVEIGNPLMKNS